MPLLPTPCSEHHCLRVTTEQSISRRAQQRGIDGTDLRRLIELIDGRCMICRGCHAQDLDRGRSGEQIRGAVCKCCRTRLSSADGAAGNLMGAVADVCRCRPGTREWDSRARLATFDYRHRAATIAEAVNGSRAQFAELVVQIETQGLDPLRAWDDPVPRVQARLEDYRVIDAGARAAKRVAVDQTVAPLERRRCPHGCQRHDEHVYIACYGTPTVIQNRDFHPDDREQHPIEHYVGYTSQLPPRKQIMEHGRETLRNLVLIVPGTQDEELALKRDADCPRCGNPLWYFRVAVSDNYSMGSGRPKDNPRGRPSVGPRNRVAELSQ